MKIKDSFVPQEKRNSKYLKTELIEHLIFRLGYIAACDEFQDMDVFGVRRTGYGVEFEIKVSKSDFDRELRCINAKEEEITKYGKDWSKFYKHRVYLTGKIPKTNYDLRMEALGINVNENRMTIPSEFYFYVPDYLAEYAVKKTQGIPYGVVSIGKTQSGNPDHFYFYVYTVMKKATKLRDQKVDPGIYREISRALSIRNRLINQA